MELVRQARLAGNPRTQLENFIRSGYVPQPKQLRFHSLCRLCDKKDAPTEIAFGGARGPGKSHALLAQMALDDCQRRDGLKCLLLRRVGKAVRESFEDLRSRVLVGIPHDYNRSSGTLTFSNGSRIILGHFHNESDIDNYLGLEYDLMGIEEATTLTASKYHAIRTCCRTSRNDWRPRIYLNANPGGIGHSWFKRRFVLEEGQPRFIPATYRDNVFLNPTYVETLNDLAGWLKHAWRDGDWDITAGQFFSTFNTTTHVVPEQTVNEWEDVWMAMDTGWMHPTAVLLFKRDLDANIFIVDEYQASKRLPLAHCHVFENMLARWDIAQERLDCFATGQDAWSKDREGRCVADSYEDAGWALDRADMSRIQGAMEILRMLGDKDAGILPTLFIQENCIDLIDLLPTLQHDPHRPEDVLKQDYSEYNTGDDLYDALRYGIMAQTRDRVVTYDTLQIPR